MTIIKSINCMNLMEIVSKNLANLKIHQNLILNYDEYYLTINDLITSSIKYFLFALLISVAFYDSIIVLILSIPICIIIPFFNKESFKNIRKKKLLYQFKDFLRIVQSFLNASYSIENSFKNSLKELTMLYGEKSMIVYEIKNICKDISINKPIELSFKKFADKTNIEDIIDFSDVMIITKKMGGNLNQTIKRAISIINDKIELEKEVNLLTAQKQFEQKIMNILPFLIIIYMNITNKEYLIILYKAFWGRLLMIILVFIYFLSLKLSNKILSIEV